MKKVTFAIMGVGNRGMAYAQKQRKYPQDMEITAIADPRPVRLEAANQFLKLPEERLFHSAEELLQQERLADVMIVATQDSQHHEHAIAALKKGYHLLLEKPISNNLQACREIAAAAKQYDRKVVVCHVLRYTVFYQQIKKLIDAGVIGDVMNLHMVEMVGYYHIAHSFVRGNWHKAAESSPMILAKCCHDMDLLLWLSGKRAKAVSSFGALTHFTRENCPEGAKERCTDGCQVDCPYNAPNFYLSRIPGWPANILHPEPTRENILEALRTTDYGRCVYKMDNDVVDHQSLAIQLEDDVTVSFTMSGFSYHQDREINIMGTKGNIWGRFRDNKLYVGVYGKEVREIDVSKLCDDFSGHGGGDGRIIYDTICLIRGDDFDDASITTIERSLESHELAFAAEASRVRGGERISMDMFRGQSEVGREEVL